MAKQRETSEITFEGVVECGCGLDVHKKEIVATVSGTSITSETLFLKRFMIFTGQQ